MWRQMLSDMYGLNVSKTDSPEAPALGAAILAMVGTGIYPSVKTACEKIIKVGETAHPSLENGKKYAEIYRIYKDLYVNLKQSFKDLSRIGD